jgi:hypothetical protein|tara:strand:+ start:881 stop:1075 length:195 start_codon:yes stop_codon:yes gene_type:complete
MTDDNDKNTNVLSVPEAGRVYLSLGRNASYEAANRGDIPTIQIGRKKVVPIRAMEKMLDDVGTR